MICRSKIQPGQSDDPDRQVYLYLINNALSLQQPQTAQGCLLHTKKVPQIPGVTSPMVYFGMWKAFFSWHVVSIGEFWGFSVAPPHNVHVLHS